MEKLVISTELINGILQYLGSRPFTEVAGLIGAIQKEAASQAPEAPKEE
jgi:hypothetical protein